MFETRSSIKRPRHPRRSLTIFLIAAVLATGTSGCGKKEAGPGGQEGGQAAGHQQRPGGSRSSQQQAIPVAVTRAESGSIASYYKATATLEADKEATVLARVSGVVESLAAEEGDLVESGAPLLRIANGEYRLRLIQAEATTANLRSRFDRLEAMMAEELATEEEYQAARSDLASAEADEGLARLNLSYTTVAAPFTGRVTQRMANVGQNISVGAELFVMGDFDPLLARVHVPSREFNKLQQDQSVDLVLDSNRHALQGRIKLISPVIDPASGTIKITVEITDYPAGTRPGDFAQVQIVTERREGTTLVPRSAVLTDKSETVVYVVADGPDDERGEKPGGGKPQDAEGHGGKPGDPNTDGKVAERRVVEIGFTDDTNAEILSGLDLGEQIVVKGQRSLKHGVPLRILEDQSAEAGR